MASTYSDYKFELIGTGEQSGTWGNTTNTNIGTAIEQAIGGKADITLSTTSTTLTLSDTNAAQNARALYLNLSGTPGGAATLNVPAIEKAYIVKNGTNQTVTVKVTGQTGVAVPTGKTMHLYNNGTDVVNALDNLPAGTTLNNAAIGTVTSVAGTGTVQGLTLTGTVTSSGNLTLGGSLSAVNLASQVTGTLPIANGGTGTTSTQFTNLTTNVTGTLPVTNGGTGQTTYTNGQLLIGNTTGNTLTKSTLTAGTGISITNGAGSITVASTVTGTVRYYNPAQPPVANSVVIFEDATGESIRGAGPAVLGSDISNVSYGYNSNATSATDTVVYGPNISAGSAQKCVLIGASILNNGGARSIYIGYDVGQNSVSDSIVIGTEITGQGANYFTFGKSGNFVYNQFTVNNSWTQSSDARLKRNVQDSNLGLSFITKLRPVTFQWKPSNEVPEELTNHHFEENKKDLEATMNGFIAQEVKQALDEVGAVTHGIWSEQEDGTQALSREMFIMPLVNAVKELKAELDTLKAEIVALKGG